MSEDRAVVFVEDDKRIYAYREESLVQRARSCPTK